MRLLSFATNCLIALVFCGVLGFVVPGILVAAFDYVDPPPFNPGLNLKPTAQLIAIREKEICQLDGLKDIEFGANWVKTSGEE